MSRHEVIATGSDFSDLECPYTGNPIRTVMVLNGAGEPLFRAADGTYSPRTRCPSKAVAALNACRRARLAHVPVPADAYTGAEFPDPVEDEEGWWFPEAFSPLRVRPRAEYLYFMHMRDGVPDPRFPKPDGSPRIRAVKPPEPVRTEREVQGQDIGQDSIEFARMAVETSGCAERSPTVSMSAPAKKPKKKRGRR